MHFRYTIGEVSAATIQQYIENLEYSDISTEISKIMVSDVDAHEEWAKFRESIADKLKAVEDELNANLK